MKLKPVTKETFQLHCLKLLAQSRGWYEAADFLHEILKDVHFLQEDLQKVSQPTTLELAETPDKEIIEKFRKQVSERGPLYDGSHLPGEASHYYELDADIVEGVLKVLDSRD